MRPRFMRSRCWRRRPRTRSRGSTPIGRPQSCCASIERNPDHPGAMHYLVHANDVPGREHELLEITRKYESVAPDNPHALHMPTHIYTRLGDWDASIRGNLRAARGGAGVSGGRARRVRLGRVSARDRIPRLCVSATGRRRRGRAAARSDCTIRRGSSPRSRRRFTRRRRRPATHSSVGRGTKRSRIVPREPATLDWDRFTWPEAVVWFARGLGAVHLQQADEARAAIQRLEQLEAATRAAGEELFARNVRVLRLEASAWLAHLSGQQESSVATMREAVDLETSTPKAPVTPAPTIPGVRAAGRPVDGAAARGRGARGVPALAGALSASFQRLAWRGAGGACARRQTDRERLLPAAPRCGQPCDTTVSGRGSARIPIALATSSEWVSPRRPGAIA